MSYPDVTWATNSHTETNVPVYAWGTNADAVWGIMDNTDMFNVVTIPEPGALSLLSIGGLLMLGRRREQ